MNAYKPIPYDLCWAKTTQDGKPGTSVLDHSRYVANVAKALIPVLQQSINQIIGKNPIIIAAAHDVGKISPGFQKKYFNQHLKEINNDLAVAPNTLFTSDHTEIGAAAINQYLGARFSVSPYAEIVGAHHGRGHQNITRTDKGEKFGGDNWSKERRSLIDKLVKEFGPFPENKPTPAQRNVLAGFVTVADWIGSDEEFFPPIPSKKSDIKKQAMHAVRECGFHAPRIKPGLSFNDVFGLSPYPVQEKFYNTADKPGLYILEAPMGTGKTEAALYAAYRLMENGENKGLYFGLPTRLTSDKIHERVAGFLKQVCEDDVAPQLAHGHAWLRAFLRGGEEFSPGSSWFSPRKRKLLYPFTVGTVDQALMSVLRVKHFFVRAFALAGKIVILDEVHSYDVYTGSIMEWMIQQLLEIGCTVIVLSATLTGERRKRLFFSADRAPQNSSYPLISFANREQTGALSIPADNGLEYKLILMDTDNVDIAEQAVTKATEGHCVLCIANTVARAQSWYNKMVQTITEGRFPLGLLHSKYPGYKRDEIENEWISKLGKNGNRPKGCILVGTQVLEQSLDIDADFLITELAPTDMILQRMGRQWRHPRPQRPVAQPEVLIVSGNPEKASSPEEIVEAFGKSNCHVYLPYILWRTRQALKGRKSIRLPKDIRPLIDITYMPSIKKEAESVEELKKNLEVYCQKLLQYANAARSDIKTLGILEDREGISTRYSQLHTTDVLLVTYVDSSGNRAAIEPIDSLGLIEVHESIPDIKTSARLHNNLVSIPTYQLMKIDALHKPGWLAKHFFDTVAVLICNPLTGDLATLDKRPAGYRYDNIKGLQRIDSAKPQISSYRPLEDYEELSPLDITQHQW